MARKRQKREVRPAAPRPASAVAARRAAGGWELVHPRCALDRREDIEEVRAMIDEGELEIATDELRWLLSGCHEFLEAHYLLGTLALAEQNDLSLARGHFGYAYQLGLTALRRAREPTPVPYALPANQPFYEAGKALAHCLVRMEKRELAVEVLDFLLRCDPTDPLGLAQMKRELTHHGGHRESNEKEKRSHG